MKLPYAHLNLRKNPFGEMDLSERLEIAISDYEGLTDQLQEPGVAVQFIGGKGTGKTSNLLALKRSFPEAPYVYIGEGESPTIPRGTLLFLDEAQRLSRLRRTRLFKRNRSFVIGTHIDLAGFLRAAGLEVQTIYPEQRLCQEKLEILFHRRIMHVRRSPGPVPRIRGQTIRDLMGKYGVDIRSMEDDLYERFQSLGGIQDV